MTCLLFNWIFVAISIPTKNQSAIEILKNLKGKDNNSRLIFSTKNKLHLKNNTAIG
jgi:hypothetical protein